MRVARVLTGMIAPAVLAGGCTQPALRPTFVNGTPEERIMAATEAIETHDTSKVPQLITMLESQDAAQRLVAGEALRRLTGRTMGYDFSAPAGERDEAVSRWRAWYLSKAGVEGGASAGRGS